jgi:hypothetical protein
MAIDDEKPLHADWGALRPDPGPLLPLSDGGKPPKRKRRLKAEVYELRRHLLSKFSHPLEVLAQAISMPVPELAKKLGCTKLSAFKMQIRCATELAPYIEQRLPVKVEVEEKIYQLVIGDVGKLGKQVEIENEQTIIEGLLEKK